MTGTVVLIVRGLLAATFAVAGGSKLAARGDFRRTLREFGVPLRFAGAGAIVLPLAELAAAGLVIATTTARAGAAVALLLLSVFCAAIARALRRGERPDCGCAGRLRATPVGPGTLVRNGALAALAVLVVAAGPGDSLHAPALGVAVAALGALVLLQGYLALQLLRQHGRLLERIRAVEEAPRSRAQEGPAVGDDAPELELGDGSTLDDRLSSGVPVALVFSNTGCGACKTLAPALERLREERAGELDIVLLENDREALQAFRVFTVPSATVIDPSGVVATPTAVGAPAVEELLAAA